MNINDLIILMFFMGYLMVNRMLGFVNQYYMGECKKKEKILVYGYEKLYVYLR